MANASGGECSAFVDVNAARKKKSVEIILGVDTLLRAVAFTKRESARE
jgi:hypothetical protein